MLSQYDFQLLIFFLLFDLFDIHGLQSLVEGLPEFVSLVVEGVVECAFFDEAFDGAFVFVPPDFYVLHGMFLLFIEPINNTISNQ